MILSEKIVMLRKNMGGPRRSWQNAWTFPDSPYLNGRVEPQSRIWNALSV